MPHVVAPGETLWSISSGNPAPDRRETVQRILDHNQMSAPPQAGEAIWVPNEGDISALVQVPTKNCPGTYS